MSDRPTRYTIEVSCPDLGEFDVLWLAECVQAVAHHLGQAGVHDYTIQTRRVRPGEF